MLMIVEIQNKTIVKHHVFTEYNGKKKMLYMKLEKVRHSAVLLIGM